MWPICHRSKFPLVISGYTTSSHLGDYYKRASRRLMLSLLKFDLPHIIFPLRKPKNWVEGCAMKSTVILKTLKAFKCPVLWIDADGEVFQFPSLFNNMSEDMALHIQANGHWLSGTLFFSPKAIPFVEKWHNKAKNSPIPDEIILRDYYLNMKHGLSLNKLPVTYNKIVHQATDTSKLVIGHYIRPDVAGSRKVKSVPLKPLK